MFFLEAKNQMNLVCFFHKYEKKNCNTAFLTYEKSYPIVSGIIILESNNIKYLFPSKILINPSTLSNLTGNGQNVFLWFFIQ